MLTLMHYFTNVLLVHASSGPLIESCFHLNANRYDAVLGNRLKSHDEKKFQTSDTGGLDEDLGGGETRETVICSVLLQSFKI